MLTLSQLKIRCHLISQGASLIAQMVKHLAAMWETQVQSLGLEDSLEKGMATIPVFLPGCKESDVIE